MQTMSACDYGNSELCDVLNSRGSRWKFSVLHVPTRAFWQLAVKTHKFTLYLAEISSVSVSSEVSVRRQTPVKRFQSETVYVGTDSRALCSL